MADSSEHLSRHLDQTGESLPEPGVKQIAVNLMEKKLAPEESSNPFHQTGGIRRSTLIPLKKRFHPMAFKKAMIAGNG
ncbi:MAG: hypothetical protein QM296_05210 [Bacillota bacterium]|nr:hypothetical protein [Bacillota bacterium]